MKAFSRELAIQLRKAARDFGAVVVSGPRRAGKTFLLRQTFPGASYHLLEDPDVLARVKADPRGWLEHVPRPAIIDEVQNAPELFSYIRTLIDQVPAKAGQWFLTGSQDFSLMEGVAESMAGRAAVFTLLPLSYRELGLHRDLALVRGSFPEVVLKPKSWQIWFSSYVQTYLERDVRSLRAVKDLTTFRRFLSLLASRNGQVLNKADIGAPLGLSTPTMTEWLGVLETTGHIIVVPPYFENFGKRLIKSPKIYWIDSGLLCFLLGIQTEAELIRSPFLGSVFEGFIASEILKSQVNAGGLRELYYFRDQQGLEVDFITSAPGGGIRLIEAKWSKTIVPAHAVPMENLCRAIKRRPVEAVIVHPASASPADAQVVTPNVRSLTVEQFLVGKPSRRGARFRA